jgi:hypothetical protein
MLGGNFLPWWEAKQKWEAANHLESYEVRLEVPVRSRNVWRAPVVIPALLFYR